jgi:hypothetical protein
MGIGREGRRRNEDVGDREKERNSLHKARDRKRKAGCGLRSQIALM